jgi:iron-sulfur cluster protein
MSREFKQEVSRALHDADLTGALGRFSEAYRGARERAYEGIDFEALRSRIAERKAFAASHIEKLVERFKTNAEARGAKVFVSDDPDAIKAYILQLAQRHGVAKVVKSKSMATEEIHLNPHLERAGLVVKETDCGEWIIQLSRQRPSHMVMPAIHMSRHKVAEIFSREKGEELPADIARLVKVVRHEMRGHFMTAEMGISGANIAVADTGSLVLVSNEGNARLVATLPKVHVAVVGVEKLVESMSDAALVVKALPKSATAQLISTYVSILTGPTPNDDGSTKELHIILMGHRRTAMARDEKFKQALQCIRCASCLNVCPVYRLVGGQVFGSVYPGGIGTILTAWFDELEKSKDIQGLCIQCGNCRQICPAKIDIPELILEIRRRLALEQGQPLLQKGIFGVVNNRRMFHSLLRAGWRAASSIAAKDGFIRHLPMFLSSLTEFRSLPAIAERPLRDTIRELEQPDAAHVKERAALYAGCLIDFAYPHVGEAVVKVLNRAGIEVVFSQRQTCCGAPARMSGAYEVAAQNAVDNIDALLETNVDYVVSACPTCTVALKQDFSHVLQSTGRAEWLEKARALSAKTIDFSTLVKKLVDEGRLSFDGARRVERITYHDSCHHRRTLGAHQAPRELARRAGYELVEMFESDMCCGMGGSYTVKMPEISAPILARKLENIEATAAGVVLSDCPGCIMQIRGGLDKAGVPIAVRHSSEVMAGALGPAR